MQIIFFRNNTVTPAETINVIDDAGQIHGTWGGCAIVPEKDDYIILGNI